MNKKNIGTLLIIVGVLAPFVAIQIGIATGNDIIGVGIGLLLFILLVFFGADLRGSSKKAVIAIVAILLLVAGVAFAVANRQRAAISFNRCSANLAAIDLAKDEWKIDYETNGTPSWNDLERYYPKQVSQTWGTNERPVCPDGGTYIIGKPGEAPVCSIHGSNTWDSWCKQHPSHN